MSIRSEGSDRWETAGAGSRWRLPVVLQALPSGLSTQQTKVELLGLGTLELAGRSRIACDASGVTLLAGRARVRSFGHGRSLMLSGGRRCAPVRTGSAPTTLSLQHSPTPTLLVHQGAVFVPGRSYRAGSALRWRWTKAGPKPLQLRPWPRWSPALSPPPSGGAPNYTDAWLSEGVPAACEALLRRSKKSTTWSDAALSALVDLDADESLARVERCRPAWPVLQQTRAARRWIRLHAGTAHRRPLRQLSRGQSEIPATRVSQSLRHMDAMRRVSARAHAPAPIEQALRELDRRKREALDALCNALPSLSGDESQWVFAVLMELGNDADQLFALGNVSWDCLRRCLGHIKGAAFGSNCDALRTRAAKILEVLGVLCPPRHAALPRRRLGSSCVPPALLSAWHQALAAWSLGQDSGLRALIQPALNGAENGDASILFHALLEAGVSVWELERCLQLGWPPACEMKTWLSDGSNPAQSEVRARGALPSGALKATRMRPWLRWLQARHDLVRRLRESEAADSGKWPLSAVLRIGGFSAFDLLLSRAEAGDSAALGQLTKLLAGEQAARGLADEAARSWRLIATLGATWLPAGADFSSVAECLQW